MNRPSVKDYNRRSGKFQRNSLTTAQMFLQRKNTCYTFNNFFAEKTKCFRLGRSFSRKKRLDVIGPKFFMQTNCAKNLIVRSRLNMKFWLLTNIFNSRCVITVRMAILEIKLRHPPLNITHAFYLIADLYRFFKAAALTELGYSYATCTAYFKLCLT